MKNILIGMTILTLASSVCLAVDRDAANYVGVGMCKICHSSAARGDQYGKWKASPHAKAFETLGTAQAKAIAKAKGIDDPQKSGKCLKCHATAYNFTETQISNSKVKVEDGVICESCHGPGKHYMMMSTMKDRQKAIAGGLVYPASQSCTLCHNAESPTFKGFDEKAMFEKIAHPDPEMKK